MVTIFRKNASSTNLSAWRPFKRELIFVPSSPFDLLVVPGKIFAVWRIKSSLLDVLTLHLLASVNEGIRCEAYPSFLSSFLQYDSP